MPTPEEEGCEEALSHFWALREKGVDTREQLRAGIAESSHENALEDLLARGLAWEGEGKVFLSEKGESRAAEIVRRNRLAERMLTDVLEIPADKVEAEACLMEHVISSGVTEAICTLLGHPPVCPHGMPIPRGSCCESSLARVESVLRPLDRLKEGERGRVAYLSFPDRPETQRLLSMGLVPGAPLRLDQRSPAFVVSVGENVIAMESSVARGIFVRV
ncbi:MAG: metal-dependent transcriptional regulator [Elusimicrobiota bacterium]